MGITSRENTYTTSGMMGEEFVKFGKLCPKLSQILVENFINTVLMLHLQEYTTLSNRKMTTNPRDT